MALIRSGVFVCKRLCNRNAQSSARRTFSTDGKNGFVLNLALPHETLMKEQSIECVKIQSYEQGSIGVYADHSAFVYTLKPGLLEVELKDKQKKEYFVSSGFATMHPDSRLDIFATEAVDLNSLDEKSLAEGLKKCKNIVEGGGAGEELTDAKMKLELYEAVEACLKRQQ